MPDNYISQAITAHRNAVDTFFSAHGKTLQTLAVNLADTYRNGSKLLVCGNGGSACDAMHISGEFAGRFVNDRTALPAIALSADPGIISAVANDYGYDHVFARQVEAYGGKGDMLIALSTSGSSPNIVKALATARERGLATVLFTGEKGKDSKAADTVLAVAETSTARIQEVHILALHLLAGLVEKQLFS